MFYDSIMQWSDKDCLATMSFGADHDIYFEVNRMDDQEGDHDVHSVPSDLPAESTE
jgi:hypothetical protein